MGKPFVVAVLALASSAALAQVRPDAGQVLEQTREPLRLPPPREADVLPRPPDPKPALPVQPQLRVKVTSFIFTGNTIFADAFLQPLVEEYIGRELTFDDLIEAATKVRAFHRERGYFLAQAYLPEQAIRDGVVQIGIIEGRIGEIEIVRRPATRLREGLLAGIVSSHWKQGQIITETGLEKPLLLINDLPTAAVTSEIRPSRTLGAADLRVTVDEGVGLANGFVDFDNHGNRFTGEYRYGASLNINNPLTLADQASFRGFRTDEDMWFARLSYLVPVWYYGTRVGVSYSEFAYNLAKDFESLQADGEGEVSSLFAFHPVLRTRNSNVILQFAYEDKRLLDQVLSTNTIEQRAIDAVKAGVVGDFRDGVFGGGLVCPDTDARRSSSGAGEPGGGGCRGYWPSHSRQVQEDEHRPAAPPEGHGERQPADRVLRPGSVEESCLRGEDLARRPQRRARLSRRGGNRRHRDGSSDGASLSPARGQGLRRRRDVVRALGLRLGQDQSDRLANGWRQRALLWRRRFRRIAWQRR